MILDAGIFQFACGRLVPHVRPPFLTETLVTREVDDDWNFLGGCVEAQIDLGPRGVLMGRVMHGCKGFS